MSRLTKRKRPPVTEGTPFINIERITTPRAISTCNPAQRADSHRRRTRRVPILHHQPGISDVRRTRVGRETNPVGHGEAVGDDGDEAYAEARVSNSDRGGMRVCVWDQWAYRWIRCIGRPDSAVPGTVGSLASATIPIKSALALPHKLCASGTYESIRHVGEEQVSRWPVDGDVVQAVELSAEKVVEDH